MQSCRYLTMVDYFFPYLFQELPLFRNPLPPLTPTTPLPPPTPTPTGEPPSAAISTKQPSKGLKLSVSDEEDTEHDCESGHVVLLLMLFVCLCLFVFCCCCCCCCLVVVAATVLQRQQLAIAQEMFKESPTLTREQKALILGFMAGSRGTHNARVAQGGTQRPVNSIFSYTRY